MVHKPKHKVHSFKGLLGDGGIDQIRLERQNTNVAYRIAKFQVISNDLNINLESTIKIYKEDPETADELVDFTEPSLLGVATINQASQQYYYPAGIIIFDNEIFSRDIYVINKCHDNTGAINYYIELEEVPVGAAALMQLKLGVARTLNLQQD